ncbi:MAG: hypothetical protein R3F11_03600 [Verrucomicrobiales bacterium]
MVSPFDSADGQEGALLGIVLIFVSIFVAAFQFLCWFFVDFITLRRGGWSMEPFVFRLTIPGLKIVGLAAACSAIYWGMPKLLIGLGLIAAGYVLGGSQRFVRHVFRDRFAQRQESSPPDKPRISS